MLTGAMRAAVVSATSNGSDWRPRLSTTHSLIVLDEPTNSLDPAGVIRLRESLDPPRRGRARRSSSAVII